jgi:hypothetical protein
MTTPWTTIWHACWGSLSGERAQAIEEYLAEKVDGLKQGELQAAVEMLAQTWDAEKSGRAPQIGTLIYAVRNVRKQARGIDTDERYEVTMAKRRIRETAVDGPTRWNVLCLDGIEFRPDDCLRLAAWAVRNGGLLIPTDAPDCIPHTGRYERTAMEGIEK